MMSQRIYPEDDPRYHTIHMHQQFYDLILRLREKVSDVDDPQAKALFETAAEVINGLSIAFEHFEQRTEEAWRR